MKRGVKILLACAVVAAGGAWVLTAPAPEPVLVAQGHTADPANGELIFTAAGCASCHAAPNSQDKTILAGGYAIESPFGTFYAPNISSGPEGIGGWSLPEFYNALRNGVSPYGQHYYPAFPYTAYSGMTELDIADLYAYMRSLPGDSTPLRAHDVGFPFNIRRGIGAWKLLYLKQDAVVSGELNAEMQRGRYLVENMSHCGECHTPRDALGGLDRDQWLKGAPNPSGKGQIPDITPAGLGWSESELVEYFTSGFTPDYDSVGGSMAAVVDNLAKLPASDREAIAAYLLALPAG